MSNNTDQHRPTPTDTLRVLLELRKGGHGPRLVVDGTELPAELFRLREWQSRRLAHTYKDFFASERYQQAATFFLTDIYAPVDFSQRDHDILRVYTFLQRFFPESVLRFLALTVELNTLTDRLDTEMATALFHYLGIAEITPAAYAEAYRICDNYVERANQIDLIIEVGRLVDRLVHIPFLSTGISLAREPAHRAGWHELHGFMERGFSAFRAMHGASHFLKLIKQRELDILDRIFQGEDNPFGL